MHSAEEIIKVDENFRSFPEVFVDNMVFHSRSQYPEMAVASYLSNFSIKYILSGEEEYIVNGCSKKVKGGNMLVVNNQSEVVNKTLQSEAFSVFIAPSVFIDIAQSHFWRTEKLLDNAVVSKRKHLEFTDEVVPQDIPELNSLQRFLAMGADPIITSDFYFEIATSLMASQQKIDYQIDQIEKVRQVTREEIFRRVNRARNYILDSLREKFDLARLSQVACLSKYHLIRCFKMVFGVTPHRFYLTQKIQCAKVLIMQNRQENLDDLALQLGYSDLPTFSKQFKQLMGIAPSAFRRSINTAYSDSI